MCEPARSVTLARVMRNPFASRSTLARFALPLAAGGLAFALYLFTISPSIGVLHDATGGFGTGLYVLTAMCVLQLGLLGLLRHFNR